MVSTQHPFFPDPDHSLPFPSPNPPVRATGFRAPRGTASFSCKAAAWAAAAAAVVGSWIPEPSDKLAMRCKRPLAELRSSSWSPSGKVMFVPSPSHLVTWPALRHMASSPKSTSKFKAIDLFRACQVQGHISHLLATDIHFKVPLTPPVLLPQEKFMFMTAQNFPSQGMWPKSPRPPKWLFEKDIFQLSQW